MNESTEENQHLPLVLEEINLVELRPVFPDTNKRCVDVWMEKINKGVLTYINFKEYWRLWVPKIYSPELNGNCLEWVIDEDMVNRMFLRPLEEFICGGDPQLILKELAKMDNPPTICGRMFKMGEPTYSCRECGMDSTCVLCVDCFKQSAHRNHKYKMGTSNGGGCCDCGDTEAWKKEPFCETHIVGTLTKESPGNKLPGDIAERAVVTFEALLAYCYDLLTLKSLTSVPPSLDIKEVASASYLYAFDQLDFLNNYCTVLFNDEHHTFDQVINMLIRVLKCSQKEAVEYVTSVDREGRTVIRCSEFKQCNDLKEEVEKFTYRHSDRPLKVAVIHGYVVAHQAFTIRLLKWLQQFISHCEGFRILFSNIALNTKLVDDHSVVQSILTRDSQLWKSARTAWHRLFIYGMLMEYESKKALSVVFTNYYGNVMKDFIKDDHDHSFSIVSLSVQLFTVPTLAHLLIAKHEAVFILLNTFMSESSRRCNAAGKFEFERNMPHHNFKRAQFILYDLRYLLSAKPEEWTDDLRHGFLHGLSKLYDLFSNMQCMDAVLRQVGQHMEYEPEWESAFNLHIKLSPIITLALEWCGSDRVVLIKCFGSLLRYLHKQLANEQQTSQVRELADHSATCLQYDVASEPVSIHLPLSRFLAGLFLHLEKYNLHFHSSDFQSFNTSNSTSNNSNQKPTPEQIIDPVLTAQAMISQVHAGMWRRNGYSLLNQLYFYHNVKCRSEMLDRDIVLLQVGASLIESNEFLIHVLNRFNLLNWVQSDFEVNALKNPEEDSMRQTINLVEEFLGLLITIIGERYVPGVGQVTADDRLKKEIIQQLCIKSLSHSELSKTLPEDVMHNVQIELERVIHEVATFKKPLDMSAKGVYELNPQFYSEYNVFFYHYTKEEHSKSEEIQRKRRKAQGELECCPPPKLPRLMESFSLVANLLQCDVMLHIMQTVLERALNFIARSFSEPQVHKVLYLIGYALQEQESGYYPFLAFTERAVKWKIYKLLENLTSSPRMDAHKDLLIWVLAKYRQVASMSGKEASPAPLQFEQHQQQTGDTDTNTNKKTDKEWRTKMAAQKRAKIMAQMAAMQKHFMKKNATLFDVITVEAKTANSDCGSAMDLTEASSRGGIAVGLHQTSRTCEQKMYTCILCQEDQTITETGSAMVLAAFVQQSTVLCQYRDDYQEPDPLYLSAKLGVSPHTSTCGHVMHARCWQDYVDNVLAKENRRPYRSRQQASFDAENHEYLCPLCECLSNTVLLLVPPLGILQPSLEPQPNINFETWLKVMALTLECKPNRKFGKVVEKDEDTLEGERIVNPMVVLRQQIGSAWELFYSQYSRYGPHLARRMETMIHMYASLFAKTTYKGFGSIDSDSKLPLLAWKSVSYTIHAIEFLLRDTEKPLLGSMTARQSNSISSLVRLSALLGASFSNRANLWSQRDQIRSYAASLLTMLLEAPSTGPSIFDIDPFGILVPLINSLPSIFHTKENAVSNPPPIITGDVFDSHVLKLVFLSHIAKILYTSDFADAMELDSNETEDDDNEDENIETKMDFALFHILGVHYDKQKASDVWRRVESACRPFLRCCAIYFHYVTDVPPPSELTEVHGDTYEKLCQYLGLPTTCDALINSHLEVSLKLMAVWRRHSTIWNHMLGERKVTIIKDPLKVNKLIDLPEDYSELINSISQFTCPNRDQEDSRNPTMCLVCGEMLCSQSYCCQIDFNKTSIGACTFHANKCGYGVGIFLRVRECEILFLRTPNRGSFLCPPYLDEYGETDQGLRRGNPLHLCHEKYQRLHRLWLGHGIHETVTRAFEQSSNTLLPTQWQHL